MKKESAVGNGGGWGQGILRLRAHTDANKTIKHKENY